MSEPQPLLQQQAGSGLSSIFATRHTLIRVNAAGTAMVCGAAVGMVIASIASYDNNWWYIVPVVIGIVVAAVTYAIGSPDPMVTRCLVAARKDFIDDRITGIECDQKRRRCLRNSLRY